MTKVEYRYRVQWNAGNRYWNWNVYSSERVNHWPEYEGLGYWAAGGTSAFRWLAIRRAKNVIVQAGLAAKEAKEKELLNVDKTVVIDV